MQNQHLGPASYQFLKQTKVVQLWWKQEQTAACKTTHRRDSYWHAVQTPALRAGQQWELLDLYTTYLHLNTGNPGAQNGSKWTRNMNYQNQA